MKLFSYGFGILPGRRTYSLFGSLLKPSDGRDAPMNSAYASFDLSGAKGHDLEIGNFWREVAETEIEEGCILEVKVLRTERMLR